MSKTADDKPTDEQNPSPPPFNSNYLSKNERRRARKYGTLGVARENEFPYQNLTPTELVKRVWEDELDPTVHDQYSLPLPRALEFHSQWHRPEIAAELVEAMPKMPDRRFLPEREARRLEKLPSNSRVIVAREFEPVFYVWTEEVDDVVDLFGEQLLDEDGQWCNIDVVERAPVSPTNPDAKTSIRDVDAGGNGPHLLRLEWLI